MNRFFWLRYQNEVMADWHENTSLDAIGARLKAIRKASGRNQSQFATWVEVNIPTWSNYERAYRRIDLDNAFKVVRKTGVTLDWIYFGDESGLPVHLRDSLDEHLEDVA